MALQGPEEALDMDMQTVKGTRWVWMEGFQSGPIRIDTANPLLMLEEAQLSTLEALQGTEIWTRE